MGLRPTPIGNVDGSRDDASTLYLKGSAAKGSNAGANIHLRTDGRQAKEEVEQSSTDEMDYDYCNQEFPSIGSVRKWPAYDTALDEVYIQDYELRVVAKNIEIWVALDLEFPDPLDCRNLLNTTEITDDQLNGFATTFDNTIYPIMSSAFSVPLYHDGTNASEMALAFFEAFNISGCSYHGEGSTIVTLVENIRDVSYYDLSASDIYFAGYFSALINELTDRNVMTIDAFDWLHRSGANPPDDDLLLDNPFLYDCVPGGFEFIPFDYESTFAHEYSHLLISSVGFKEPWVDEGMAEYATSIVGYSNTSADPGDKTFKASLQTFLGFSTYGFGGPEQSLTRWEDGGSEELIGDYGCAYSFFLYLEGQLGTQILKEFRNDPSARGLAGLQSVLLLNGLNTTVLELVKNWLVALAVAGEITNGALVNGEKSDQSHAFAIPRIPLSKINWTNPECYDKPGVPTNGADFVRLREEGGNTTFLSADRISSIEFIGSQFYPVRPPEWIETNFSSLFSGSGDLLDRSLLREIVVPNSGVISLELAWDLEPGFDFFFVQVYDETEGKWVSLKSQNTTVETMDVTPKFYPALPGLTGSSGGKILEQLYEAQAYAGKTVYIALRFCTDWAVSSDGVMFYGLTLDDSIVWDATNLSSWQSLAEVFPIPVEWHVSLVSYTPGGQSVWAKPLSLEDGNQLIMNDTDKLEEYIGSEATIVAALVTALDMSETIFEFAMYELYVNGILQPGGGA